MNWILLVIAFNNGGMTSQQIPMQSEQLCNEAKNNLSKVELNWKTGVRFECIQVRK